MTALDLDKLEKVVVRDRRFNVLVVDMCKDSIYKMMHLETLGVPKWVEKIPTAGVILRAGGRIEFEWNPDFFDALEDGEIKFATEHELDHVWLDHLRRGKGKDANLWNIAIDVIVNEYRLAQGTWPGRLMDGLAPWLPGGIWTIDLLQEKMIQQGAPKDCLGKKSFKPYKEGEKYDYDRLQFDAEMLYKVIRKYAVSKGVSLEFSEHSLDTPIESAAKGGEKDKENSGDASGEGVKDHENGSKSKDDSTIPEVNDDIEKEIQDIINVVKETRSGDSMAGKSGTCPELRSVDPDPIFKTIPWKQVVANWLGEKFDDRYVENWMPNRKLTAFYPDVLLPTDHDDEEQVRDIYIYGDTSGSMAHISGYVAAMLADIVDDLTDDKTQKKKNNITLFGFDTQVIEWDPEEARRCNVPGFSGGTSFATVAAHVHGNHCAIDSHGNSTSCVSKHPDLVIMVTDGCDTPPKVQRPENWLWLIVGSSNFGRCVSKSTSGIGIIYEIKDGELT